VAGGLAKVLGAPGAVLVCGTASVIGAAVFTTGLGRIHRALRPVLEAKGFVKPAAGLSTPIPAAGAAPVAGPEPLVPDDGEEPT